MYMILLGLQIQFHSRHKQLKNGMIFIYLHKDDSLNENWLNLKAYAVKCFEYCKRKLMVNIHINNILLFKVVMEEWNIQCVP